MRTVQKDRCIDMKHERAYDRQDGSVDLGSMDVMSVDINRVISRVTHHSHVGRAVYPQFRIDNTSVISRQHARSS